MTRLGIAFGLIAALSACTKSPKEEPKHVVNAFTDNGAAASQRISQSIQEPTVAAKLRTCLGQLKSQGLVATDIRYNKSGGNWTFDNAKVTKASLAKGEDAAVAKCIEESVRGTSFAVNSNEQLETVATQFVVKLGFPIPLPPEGTGMSNDAIARMISTGGGVITMEGCSTCQLKTDGSGNYQCVRKKSGNEGDCEIISSNSCATSTKACVSGFYGGSRGVVMF